MKWPRSAFALCVLAVWATGCGSGPVGNWRLREVIPAEVADQCPLRSLTFDAKGQYTAEIRHAGQTEQMAGSYTLDKNNEQLVLTDSSGEPHVYGAQICGSCAELYIWNNTGKRRWTATFVRTW